MKKWTAVYLRVSTEKQKFASQREEIRQWCAAHKIPHFNIKEYKDQKSGKDTKRPGFQKMKKDWEAGKIEHVVVYKIDRLSRHAITAIRLLLHFDELGIKFSAITQPMFSHGTPMRLAMIAIFAELAQMERQNISDRVTAGLAVARKNGKKLGRPSTITSEMVAEIIKLRKAGSSERAIAKAMGLSPSGIHKTLCKHKNLL